MRNHKALSGLSQTYPENAAAAGHCQALGLAVVRA